ncbi:MAG: hypothetical protein EOP06_24140 [Proteobacteria bacterium]|nr:MAG: hypothetical protein EOP06_24140 [Pseudomonadota bacterium]
MILSDADILRRVGRHLAALLPMVCKSKPRSTTQSELFHYVDQTLLSKYDLDALAIFLSAPAVGTHDLQAVRAQIDCTTRAAALKAALQNIHFLAQSLEPYLPREQFHTNP